MWIKNKRTGMTWHIINKEQAAHMLKQRDSDGKPEYEQVDEAAAGDQSQDPVSNQSGVPAGTDNTGAPAPEIKHIGGGIYELPDGTRVKGKEEAAAKWAEIQAVGK